MAAALACVLWASFRLSVLLVERRDLYAEPSAVQDGFGEPILELRGVSKHYPGFSLRDVSFSLPRGYVCGLIGPNGAGKTTIVKMILGLVRRDGGGLACRGTDPPQPSGP